MITSESRFTLFRIIPEARAGFVPFLHRRLRATTMNLAALVHRRARR
jgi:hypothetical protein